MAALTQRSLQRRLRQAQLGRFKLMADFDWNWPRKIDRDLVERALTLVTVLEGQSYRIRESEQETAARRKTKPRR